MRRAAAFVAMLRSTATNAPWPAAGWRRRARRRWTARRRRRQAAVAMAALVGPRHAFHGWPTTCGPRRGGRAAAEGGLWRPVSLGRPYAPRDVASGHTRIASGVACPHRVSYCDAPPSPETANVMSGAAGMHKDCQQCVACISRTQRQTLMQLLFLRDPCFDLLPQSAYPTPRAGLRRPQTTRGTVVELLTCLLHRINWAVSKAYAFDVDTLVGAPEFLCAFRFQGPRQLWHIIQALDRGESINPITLRYGDESCFVPVPLGFKNVSDGMLLLKVAHSAREDGRTIQDVAAVLSCDYVDCTDNMTRQAHALCFKHSGPPQGRAGGCHACGDPKLPGPHDATAGSRGPPPSGSG